MLTTLSIPKPFVGSIAVIQRNALQSWARRNEFGTPLLHSVFEQVKLSTRRNLLCYVNADISLTQSFISAIQSIPLPRFLRVGQRWDVVMEQPWD